MQVQLSLAMAFILTLAACTARQEPPVTDAAPAPTETGSEVEALSTPSTTPVNQANDPGRSVAANPRPTPVSETTGAIILANMGAAPTGDAPQLTISSPKELELAAETPLTLLGFNLEGSKVTAQRVSDQQTVELQPDSVTGEHISIPASEWRKLGVGVYSFIVTDPSGRAATLPVPVNIE